MKILAKNKKLIFSLFLSLIAFLAAIFAFIIKDNNFSVYAEYEQYYNDAGYYNKDGVIFYAIKVTDGKFLWAADKKIKFTYEGGSSAVVFDPDTDNETEKQDYVNLYKKADGTIVYKVANNEKSVTKFLNPENETQEIDAKNINFEKTPEYSLSNGEIQAVKYGETVLLKEGEQILISFANKNVQDFTEVSSNGVDFLNVKIETNGVENIEDLSIIAETENQKLSYYSIYIYELNKVDSSNPEGLVEFSANYQYRTLDDQFNFKFYVFHENTYKTTQSNDEIRPNARIENVSTVHDENTRAIYYSENFYYYSNQDWAKIVYNPLRYELVISKNVNSFASTYTFEYDINTKQIVLGQDVPRTTQDIYVAKFYWDTDEDGKAQLNNGNVTIYLKDIGIYDIKYNAVYYGEDNSKTYLETLNEKTKKDLLTIYGVQATYNDFEEGQKELREITNPQNSISADVTGLNNFTISDLTGSPSTVTITKKDNGLDLNKIIASTNQPQVRFITNSTITKKDNISNFAVYYSETLGEEGSLILTKDTTSNYTINSNFTKPGYYCVIVKNAYSKFKVSVGASTAMTKSDEERTQIFVFRIKNQSPSISIFKLQEQGDDLVYSTPIMSGSFDGNTYYGSYVNKGVFIEEYEENSSFDLPITFKLERIDFTKTAFGDNEADYLQNIEVTTLKNDKNISKTGYKITEDGHYRLIVTFGSSNIKRYFDVDTQPISKVQSNDVGSVASSNTYRITSDAKAASQNTAITNSSFILSWAEKASGAKITASYTRYAMENSTFIQDPQDYILDNTKVIANSEIKVQDNPSTAYTKPISESYITANEVLTLPGLYIFNLVDEAGNEATFKIVLDNSVPTILQANEPEDENRDPSYEIISGLNTIAAKTRVFFGTHKLVKLNITKDDFNIDENDARFVKIGDNFYMQSTLSASITNETKNTQKNSISNANLGYDILNIETDTNGNVLECTYNYTITDETNSKVNYLVTISTDKTGVNVITNDGKQFVDKFTKTTNATYDANTELTHSKRETYRTFVDSNIIYLTFKTLTPEGINAFIDLEHNGLTVDYYALVYNNETGCYEYSENVTQTIVITQAIYDNEKNWALNSKGELEFKYELNVVSGKTLPGKYVIKRNYTKIDEDDTPISRIVGNDFVQREYLIFVDRNPIISAPTTSIEEQRFGAYSYITLFDGQDAQTEIKYQALYNQNQNNLKAKLNGSELRISLSELPAVLLTNKLPVGIYIPTDKYGRFIASNNLFENSVLFENLDENILHETTYSPFKLTVYVIGPDGRIYEYNNVSNTNYYILNNSASLNSTSEWVSGNYALTITCGTTNLNQKETPTQTFNFIFKVDDAAPQINIVGGYNNLNMITSQQLTEINGVYYSNADYINVSFADPSTEYITKIGKISYRFAGGSWQYVEDEYLTAKNFSISIANNVSELQIKVEYEVYCEDSNLQKLYPNGHYETTKTIKFNRVAPTDVLNALKNSDLIVKNINSDLLREVDERYNSTITEGIYQYYSFAIPSTNLDSILAASLNSTLTGASEIYFKKIDGKYSNPIEIQSPFKNDVSAGNVFNKELALTLNYNKFIVGTTSFETEKYYEFVEYDIYGNTSIFTVFVGVNGSLTLNTSAGEYNVELVNNKLILKLGDETPEEIIATRMFNINSLTTGNYKYFKFSLNGKTYLLTPFVENGKVYNITLQSETSQVDLNNIVLNPGRYTLTLNLIGNNDYGTYPVRVSVRSNDERLNYSFYKENDEVGIIVSQSQNNAVTIKDEDVKITIIGETSSREVIHENDKHYILRRSNENWANAIFLIQLTDNFGETYSILKAFTESRFNRFETADELGLNDITSNMQTSSNIVVSHNIYFNFSNLYKAKVEKRGFNATQFVNANIGELTPKTGYYQYKLTKSNEESELFNGGVVFYKITLTANTDVDVNIPDEVVYVTIYNQLPKLIIRNSAGVDITNELYEKTITQSDEVYLYFEAENEISQSFGYDAKVYLRRRGSSEGYFEISNEYAVQTPGTYDILIQNESDDKILASKFNTENFIISSYDVMFYSVINTETDEPVNPTGEPYIYEKTSGTTETINYHYILNTDSYSIATNNGATYVQESSNSNGAIITKIYKVSAGTNFDKKIAITVIPKDNNILNTFGYFVGDNFGVAGVQSINSPETDIYLYKTNTENSITLRWNYYYGIEANKIKYEISRGSGSDAVVLTGESYNKTDGFMEYTLDKSGIYTIKFTDRAGNIQILTTNKGTFDSYKINFIKSVIFEINDSLPIDNAVYNSSVTINVPQSTKSYYQTNPTLVATRNGQTVVLSTDENGRYVAEDQGQYVVYFTASKNNVELKDEPVRFTIINPNESRWAFNYHNYNDYAITAKYNNEKFDLSQVQNGNEIVMSVILGNDSLDNGVYSFEMTTEENLSFEFSVWLNNTKPDILVSHEEGTKTTENIIVRYNTENLYDAVGDCFVKINNKTVSTINSDYFEDGNYDTTVLVELTQTSSYLIQVYTANDKLIYSYKVEIVDPLNTITIILISVGSGLVVAGVVLFVLLRKKLRIR